MNMKNILLLLFLLLGTNCVFGQKSNCKDKAKLFVHHFKILDSIAAVTTNDTLINCQASIQYMEDNTGI